MNVFEKLIDRLKAAYSAEEGVVIDTTRPLDRAGFWTFSVAFADEYLVSLAWNRHFGFQLTAGYEVGFGSAYDEIFRSPDDVFERIENLVKERLSTTYENPIGLADLRRIQGLSQTALAEQLEITKGGLSQIEADEDLMAMKVGTIVKLVDALGATLSLTAKFPDGVVRRLLIR